MKPYLFYQGLIELSQTLKGNENIYLGIRPYGFHAGNATSLAIYPQLLCKALKEKGLEPRFHIYLFINDWEQDKLDGPNPKKYPFNICPVRTTFQYTPDYFGCCNNIVDHWQPIIEKDIYKITQNYPLVKIESVRNSSLKHDTRFKDLLLKTIKYPEDIFKIIKTHSTKPVLKEPISFAKAVCPRCHSARGKTIVIGKDTINNICDYCDLNISGEYEKFDFWFYHKMLALPRLQIFNIDLCITGYEHYNEGDYYIRQDLIKRFQPSIKLPQTLYAPLILGENNDTMGKSRGNAKYIELNDLMMIINQNINKEKIIIKKGIDVAPLVMYDKDSNFVF